ncbi:hypothetical protein L596_030759 [Steinernema carpocapsae]|uniref:EB domain-containing protein n=1 Tax=Steinernema carpocapsae TaxID=34508 RepID=A0A4V5ZWX4_STECR|nr:hypothetical protein L596_030759 [Steinernema carpocapsae]
MRFFSLLALVALLAIAFAAPIDNDVEASGEDAQDPIIEKTHPADPNPCHPAAATEAPMSPCTQPEEEEKEVNPCDKDEEVTEVPCAKADASTPAPCPKKCSKKVQKAEESKDDKDEDFAKDPATEATKSNCTSFGKCFSDDDCSGGKGGYCFGAFKGTCYCHSCIHLLPCTSDLHCGGFEGACNVEKNQCDCLDAPWKNTEYETFGKGLIDFCNKKTCTVNGNDCYGLPCQSGQCICKL